MRNCLLSLVMLFSSVSFAEGYRCGVFEYPMVFVFEPTEAGVTLGVRYWDQEPISGLAQVDIVDGTTIYSLPGQATLTIQPDGQVIGAINGRGWGYCVEDRNARVWY